VRQNPDMLEKRTYFVDSGSGWRIALHRYRRLAALRADADPVVIVPGFAMNSYILGYHPTGRPLAAYLADRGYEVFCLDLRGQGAAHPTAGHRRFGMSDVALTDLDAAVSAIPRHSTAGAPRGVTIVGCSLGATYMFMHAAWRSRPEVARLVNLGGPLRWDAVHPVVAALARAPAGAFSIRGTRSIARAALPVLAKIPGLLDLYLNPALCDLTRPESLVHTVDDPVPRINAEIARWVRSKDLVLEGRNLSDDARGISLPLLTIIANADGIVPPETVRSGDRLVGTPASGRSVVVAGDASARMAHADLFISERAESDVFRPLADWLDRGLRAGPV